MNARRITISSKSGILGLQMIKANIFLLRHDVFHSLFGKYIMLSVTESNYDGLILTYCRGFYISSKASSPKYAATVRIKVPCHRTAVISAISNFSAAPHTVCVFAQNTIRIIFSRSSP